MGLGSPLARDVGGCWASSTGGHTSAQARPQHLVTGNLASCLRIASAAAATAVVAVFNAAACGAACSVLATWLSGYDVMTALSAEDAARVASTDVTTPHLTSCVRLVMGVLAASM